MSKIINSFTGLYLQIQIENNPNPKTEKKPPNPADVFFRWQSTGPGLPPLLFCKGVEIVGLILSGVYAARGKDSPQKTAAYPIDAGSNRRHTDGHVKKT